MSRNGPEPVEGLLEGIFFELDRNLMPAWLYILRLKSGALYVGATTNLDLRYKDHCSGNACRTTNLDSPVTLIHSEEFHSFSDARKREAQVKRWTKAKKEALIAGDLVKLKLLSRSKRRIHPEKKSKLIGGGIHRVRPGEPKISKG